LDDGTQIKLGYFCPTTRANAPPWPPTSSRRWPHSATTGH